MDGLRDAPSFEVVAPGRVNLIGDHIDYLGFDVLPVALAQGIRITANPRDDARIRIRSALHNEEVSILPASRVAPAHPGHWSNYVRASLQELYSPDLKRGFDGIISSDLPPAGGLSSSSALVVASALAYLHANDRTMDTLLLAERMARAERYVGTAGGGMDQAACLLARAGTAALIGFDPLRVTHVEIPENWQFVVADSLERAEKSGRVRDAYNARAHGTHAALDRLRVAVAEDDDSAAMLDAGRKLLDPISFRRFRHVITEAERVRTCVHALHADDPASFGRCMAESHASLRVDFEVSTPSLDRLCEILGDAGAMGARVTGAGMGGSVVALCRRQHVEGIFAALDAEYYAVRRVSATAAHRFVVEPSGGARVSVSSGREV